MAMPGSAHFKLQRAHQKPTDDVMDSTSMFIQSMVLTQDVWSSGFQGLLDAKTKPFYFQKKSLTTLTAVLIWVFLSNMTKKGLVSKVFIVNYQHCFIL